MTVTLTGKRIDLVPFTDADVPALATGLADLALNRLVNPGIAVPFTVDDLLDADGWLAQSRAVADNHLWSMRDRQTDQFIGICALDVEDAAARSAEIGINITAAAYRGRGYGSETMRLVMAYGFMQLDLNRQFLKVFAYNHAAIRLYQKLGFQLEATEREALYRDGVYYDQLYMGLLRAEWEGHAHAGQ